MELCALWTAPLNLSEFPDEPNSGLWTNACTAAIRPYGRATLLHVSRVRSGVIQLFGARNADPCPVEPEPTATRIVTGLVVRVNAAAPRGIAETLRTPGDTIKRRGEDSVVVSFARPISEADALRRAARRLRNAHAEGLFGSARGRPWTILLAPLPAGANVLAADGEPAWWWRAL